MTTLTALMRGAFAGGVRPWMVAPPLAGRAVRLPPWARTCSACLPGCCPRLTGGHRTGRGRVVPEQSP